VSNWSPPVAGAVLTLTVPTGRSVIRTLSTGIDPAGTVVTRESTYTVVRDDTKTDASGSGTDTETAPAGNGETSGSIPGASYTPAWSVTPTTSATALILTATPTSAGWVWQHQYEIDVQ